MSDIQDDKGARIAFQKITETLGLTLPADREQAIFEGYKGLRAMADGLRRPRTAASEPAGIFVAGTIGREG
ncbi:hypothetical protein NUH88_16415 [Nisaea acidiphila]|uniref:Uncharacterized protein n=1 Tax=Nisaea acidiphila TaxID=1862145 RepID=A0A9J7AP40_9PROT|nr:hypothetical protein [Nisaea acidiphila]UUX48975.1 hypothetical protein NUH88_16415 [Nisaea acidiphila]